MPKETCPILPLIAKFRPELLASAMNVGNNTQRSKQWLIDNGFWTDEMAQTFDAMEYAQGDGDQELLDGTVARMVKLVSTKIRNRKPR